MWPDLSISHRRASVDDDLCAEAPGALPMPDQRVPRAPQLGPRSGPAPPAARRSTSSCSLPSVVLSAPTRDGEEAGLICIDELTVTFSGTEHSWRCLPRKPRPSGVQVSAVLCDYTSCLAGIDHADALLPLHDCLRSSTCTDVLR